jgi:hypothetical protein
MAAPNQHNVLSKSMVTGREIVAKCVDIRFSSNDPTQNPLLNKSIKTICNAIDQLNHIEVPQKFILIDFSFDISAALPDSRQLELIKLISAGLENEDIKLVVFKHLEIMMLA